MLTAMDFFTILLTLHIFCGSLSLLSGLHIMLAKKGNSRHKRIGKLYFYAMLTASVAAIPMSCLHPNFFLFLFSTIDRKQDK